MSRTSRMRDLLGISMFIIIVISALGALLSNAQVEAMQLFDSAPGDAVILEGRRVYMGGDLFSRTEAGTTRCLTFADDNYGGTVFGFIAFYSMKDYYGWVSGNYAFNYYTRIPYTWDDISLWVKWYNRSMAENDKEYIDLYSWKILTGEDETQGVEVQLEASPPPPYNFISATITFTLKGSRSITEDYNEVLESDGWLRIGHATVYTYSYAPWKWDDRFDYRGMALLDFSNNYLKNHKYWKISYKIQIIQWWGLEILYRGHVIYFEYVKVINEYRLGNNYKDSTIGDDGYIFVSPGLTTINIPG